MGIIGLVAKLAAQEVAKKTAKEAAKKTAMGVVKSVAKDIAIDAAVDTALNVTNEALLNTTSTVITEIKNKEIRNQAKMAEEQPDHCYLFLIENNDYRKGRYSEKGKTKYSFLNTDNTIVYTAEGRWDEKRKNAVLIDSHRKKVGVMEVEIIPPKRIKAIKAREYTITYSLSINGKNLGKKTTIVQWTGKFFDLQLYNWRLIESEKGRYSLFGDNINETAYILPATGIIKERTVIGFKNPDDIVLVCLLSILVYFRERVV